MAAARVGSQPPLVCRLCLTSRGNTHSIFGDDAAAHLADRIRACVRIQVTEDDELPLQICGKCVSNVNNWHVFKRVCDESQVKLQDWLNNGIPNEEMVVKNEPSSDDDMTIDASYPGIDAIEESGRNKLQPEGPPILASLGLAPRSEKSNTDPRADWDRVVAIQNLIDRDEVVEGIESGEEIDAVHESDADSDSEQDLIPIQDVDDKIEYKSKDGYITWSKKPLSDVPCESLKRKFISGSNGEACNAQTPFQAWLCLITDSMINHIVYHTNEYIEYKYPATGITGDLQENLTNAAEIKALFGILYLSGIMRPAFYNLSEMWWADGCGLNIVQSAMTLDRFRFLLKCMRFDSFKILQECTRDKLHPISKIFDDFVENCKQSYNFGQSAVIDERFELFDGPCSFKKSIKTKKTIKNGIKMYALVESETFYTGALKICTETFKDDNMSRSNYNSDVIKQLTSHMNDSEITVIIPSKFASLKLALYLKNQLTLYCVGNLKAKCKEVPPIFVSQERKTGSSLFGFTDDSVLVSYINSRRKASIILSTRPDHYVNRKAPRSRLPEALVWYKQRCGTAHAATSIANVYTTSKRCNRWPLKIFFSLLDIAAINAQVIWLSNRRQHDVVYRRNFIRSLALELMNDHIKTTNNSFEDKPISLDLDPLLAIRGGPARNIASDAVVRKHRRCKLCPRNADRKTRSCCAGCTIPVCKEHYKPLCICCALKF